jgi:hypothetical protein
MSLVPAGGEDGQERGCQQIPYAARSRTIAMRGFMKPAP